METFLDFFENIPTTYRTVLLVSGLVFFWILESAIPLFQMSRNRYRHAGLNIVFNFTTLAVNFTLAFVLVSAADYSSTTQMGLLYVVSLPLWVQVVAGILLLDLIAAYFSHWVEHKVKWLWKFHLIHHTDTHIDVTTGLRHHPGESVFRALFTIAGVLIIGTPIGIVLLYQSISAFFAQLTHANIKSPRRIDRVISWIFVTPNMHKVHHHFEQPLTDTNYGNVFSIWDRLFGTFADVAELTELNYGIDTHMSPEENDRLGNLMAIPFQEYRPSPGSKFGSSDIKNTE